MPAKSTEVPPGEDVTTGPTSTVSGLRSLNGGRSAIARVALPCGSDPAATLSGQALLRETPTVTYTPLTGNRFVRSVLEPMPPQVLLGMVGAGWAVDSLFRFSVRSINGVRNESRAPLFAQGGDHVRHRHVPHGEFVRIDPDPHAVVALPEDQHFADPRQP